MAPGSKLALKGKEKVRSKKAKHVVQRNVHRRSGHCRSPSHDCSWSSPCTWRGGCQSAMATSRSACRTWEGCTSISRAARHGLGNHVFRLLMLPCAMLVALHWWSSARWLRTGATPGRQSRRGHDARHRRCCGIGGVCDLPRQRRRGLPFPAPLRRDRVLRLQLSRAAAVPAAGGARVHATADSRRRCWRCAWRCWRWASATRR